MLGSGGLVGNAFHAGALAALSDSGWDPRNADLIVGTSIGAVTAAMLRAGISAEDLFAFAVGKPMSSEGAEIMERGGGWVSFDGIRSRPSIRGGPGSLELLGTLCRHPERVRPGLLLAALSKLGRVSTLPVADAFNRLFPDGWPERRTWVCAVDLDLGKRVVFGAPGAPQVDIGTAVSASIAVPSIFSPVTIGKRRFIDGGMCSPSNSDVLALAATEGVPLGDCLDTVYVSMPLGIGAWPKRPGVDIPGRWFNHISLTRRLGPARRAGLQVVVCEPGAFELEVMGYNCFDTRYLTEVAERARESMAFRLAEVA